jgi:hypothetical protein
MFAGWARITPDQAGKHLRALRTEWSVPGREEKNAPLYFSRDKTNPTTKKRIRYLVPNRPGWEALFTALLERNAERNRVNSTRIAELRAAKQERAAWAREAKRKKKSLSTQS